MTIFKATFYTENDTEESIDIDMSDAVNSLDLSLKELWGTVAEIAVMRKPTRFADLVGIELICD